MVTLKDIAHKAGLSVTTVSLVLNNRDKLWRISDRKRQVVLDVAKQLEYVPNLRARAMVTRKARTLGMISPLSMNIFDVGIRISFFGLLAGVEAVCKESEYYCLFTTHDEANLEKFITPRVMQDGSIDGVVLVGYAGRSAIEKIGSMGLPCVHIGTNIDPGTGVESVYGDFDGGIEQAVRKLISWGHSRIQLIIPKGPGPERIAKNFLNLKFSIGGFDPEVFISKKDVPDPQSDLDDAHELVADILRRSDPPSAFIGISSGIPEGLIAGLSKAGRLCPRDYSVIVSGNGMEPVWIKSGGISLSTIDLPDYEIGRRAAEVLLSSLGEKQRPDESYKIVPCTAVYRESCGPKLH